VHSCVQVFKPRPYFSKGRLSRVSFFWPEKRQDFPVPQGTVGIAAPVRPHPHCSPSPDRCAHPRGCRLGAQLKKPKPMRDALWRIDCCCPSFVRMSGNQMTTEQRRERSHGPMHLYLCVIIEEGISIPAGRFRRIWLIPPDLLSGWYYCGIGVIL